MIDGAPCHRASSSRAALLNSSFWSLIWPSATSSRRKRPPSAQSSRMRAWAVAGRHRREVMGPVRQPREPAGHRDAERVGDTVVRTETRHRAETAVPVAPWCDLVRSAVTRGQHLAAARHWARRHEDMPRLGRSGGVGQERPVGQVRPRVGWPRSPTPCPGAAASEVHSPRSRRREPGSGWRSRPPRQAGPGIGTNRARSPGRVASSWSHTSLCTHQLSNRCWVSRTSRGLASPRRIRSPSRK